MTQSERPNSSQEDRPAHYLEARAYFEELKQNPQWLSANDGLYSAIKDRQILDQDINFHYLTVRVWPVYGEDVFIGRAWKEPKVYRITNVFSRPNNPPKE